MMESSWSTTSVKRTMLLLPRTRRVWTSTQTPFGTSSGSAKAKATKEKVWSASPPMEESRSGPWKKDYNIQTLCSWGEFLSPTKRMLLKTWTLGSPAVSPSNSWRESHPCTWPPLKKESFTAVPRATPSSICRSTLGTTGPSTRSEPTPSFMTFSSPAPQTGAANFGTGDGILPLTLSKASISTMKLSTSSGAPKNQLFLLQSARMEDCNSGTFLSTQGSREEEHVGPHLHGAGSKQDKVVPQNDGALLQRGPSAGDWRHKWIGGRLQTE